VSAADGRSANAEDDSATPSGEGERRAQRGYVPQYDLGARLIYEAMAAGRLRWVGVADRDAGAFDDIVLGLGDRIAAYQVKTSAAPEPFSIKTLLLGAAGLLSRMLESRRKLRAVHPNALVETSYACDDYPSTTDKLCGSASSAALLRAHEAHRRSWSLADWRKSPFAAFVAEVQAASNLDDDAFHEFWRHTRFFPNGQARYLANTQRTSGDLRRIQEIAALLPRLVSDPVDRDRWTLEDMLARLNWREPFQLRHGHAFPVDALYESNASTQEALQQVLSTVTRGYVSLVGPPGCGKSTLLAAGLLPTPQAVVLRYLAFVPDEGHGLGRAEAFDFLHDLVKQLKQHGLGGRIMPGTELPELRDQLQQLLNEASNRFRGERVRTLIVIDGLDHVPREERPQASFLRELPQEHAIPDGIVFILGTQHLNLDDIPPSVLDQAGRPDRSVRVSPLSRTAVTRLADIAGVPDDVDREILYKRTDGHALSTRYVIMGLLAATTSKHREEWLSNGPAYGGDVNTFYERAWHALEQSAQAREVLAYLALAEGPISPSSLDDVVGGQATDSAWLAAGHLLVEDHRAAWSIFHNSFRLFLQAKTGLRRGVADASLVQRRYKTLADMARAAQPDDPQRWMELRYRARAADTETVARLASPERFRAEFIHGRDPGDIRDDIAIAFGIAKAQGRADLVVDLMLSSHEISMRAEAIGDDIFDALISLGDRRTALGLLRAEGITLTPGKGYELVDAFLEAKESVEARKLFDSIEPVGQLLGSEPVEPHRQKTDILVAWAKRALVFRQPGQILTSLARLRVDPRFGGDFDLAAWQEHLKIVAARGQLERHPNLDPDELMTALQIGLDDRQLLFFLAARAAFEVEKDGLAVERLALLVPMADKIEPGLRRELARIAVRLGRLEAATAFLHDVPPPTLHGWTFNNQDDDWRWIVHQIITYASLARQLGQQPTSGATPKSWLLATFQNRLETLGRLRGEGLANVRPSLEPVREFREFLTFLQHAEGERAHDSDRWAIDKVLDCVVAAVVAAAHHLGAEVFSGVTKDIDTILAGNAGRLGQSKVRRAYALEVFRYERDSDRAESRIGYQIGTQRSPGEELAEAGSAARAYVTLGLQEKARSILAGMHSDGLGYARPAKKDPQYAAWRDLLERACDEDPAGRPERLLFFGRLLSGMAETEGKGAARRIVGAFLGQSAQAGPEWAARAADLVEETGLVSWRGLVQSLVKGVVKRNPDLAVAGTVIVGRLALPFASDSSENPYPDLIRAAPDNQVCAVVEHALACLETDCHQARRIPFLEEVVDAAAARGISLGNDALARWRSELPAPTSGNSPENPFFLVRTLEDFNAVLERVGKDAKSWDMVPAFERVLQRIPYDAAKVIFEANEVLQKDERAIDAMAEAALSAGRPDEAVPYAAALNHLATNKGGWGDGWTEPTKQRYHRLDVRLRGDVARRAAFDAFAEDLANKRGYADSLLPDLCDVIELLSPRPTWADAWARLEGLLRLFREYQRGVDLQAVSETTLSDDHTLGDLLHRALSTTSLELSKMARTAAVELARVPGGAAVVVSALPRLWKAGGDLALDAAQIAWECRDRDTIRESVLPLLPEMLDSDDIAIRKTSSSLAREWDQEVTRKQGGLPALYRLELPRTPQAARFEPPSGTSPTSSGLYTEDVNTWTWPLQQALETTVKASGLEIANLRTRAAQLMERLGGTAVFGPEATKQKLARLRRLKLHSSYRKLPVSVAFQAARELLGELDAADAIDPSALPFILPDVAAFPSGIATLPPCPRPVGVPKAEIDEPYHSTDSHAWRDRVDQDVVVPKVPGYLVLAAAAIHRRHYFHKEWTVEQYYGPNADKVQEGLSSRLLHLPRVLVLDELYPLYDGPAPGAVVHPLGDISGSIPFNMVALCPGVAIELGWRPDPRHLFTYLNSQGDVVAQTIYWRDGGVHSREPDAGIFSIGYLVVVKEDRAKEVAPHLALDTISESWRVTQDSPGAVRSVTRASRARSE
jgi:hypothetical protein